LRSHGVKFLRVCSSQFCLARSDSSPDLFVDGGLRGRFTRRTGFRPSRSRSLSRLSLGELLLQLGDAGLGRPGRRGEVGETISQACVDAIDFGDIVLVSLLAGSALNSILPMRR
jgi:hypothetical protein